MNRIFKTLATAVVVLALLVPTTYAAPKREVGSAASDVFLKVVKAIKKLIGQPLDEIVWPKP
jgi:hypothetical protein